MNKPFLKELFGIWKLNYYILLHCISELPELQQVVGEDAANTFIEEPTEGNLKECFSAMMNAPKEKIEAALNDLVARFSEMGVLLKLLTHHI